MFSSAYRKIDRANQHLQECERLIEHLEKTNKTSVQDDAQGRGQRISHEIPELEDGLANLALVLGDAVHNFRTALDHAWVVAVKSVGLTPTKDTKFPVRKESQQLIGALEGIKIHTTSPELFNVMVSS